jgi:hypothetical protein
MVQTKTETEPRGFRAFVNALDPADRLAEITCGLIMVLSILLTAGYYVVGSPDPARSLLIAAIGCNVAWGLIDGFFYVGYSLIDRSQQARLITGVRSAPNRPAAEQFLKENLDNDFYEALDDSEKQRALGIVYDGLIDAEAPETKVNREDLASLLGAFTLNFLATVPATIPFILIPDWRVALRVSNLVCVVMLFIMGYRFAGHIHANPWKIGGILMLFGMGMVAIAIALGG